MKTLIFLLIPVYLSRKPSCFMKLVWHCSWPGLRLALRFSVRIAFFLQKLANRSFTLLLFRSFNRANCSFCKEQREWIALVACSKKLKERSAYFAKVTLLLKRVTRAIRSCCSFFKRVTRTKKRILNPAIGSTLAEGWGDEGRKASGR